MYHTTLNNVRVGNDECFFIWKLRYTVERSFSEVYLCFYIEMIHFNSLFLYIVHGQYIINKYTLQGFFIKLAILNRECPQIQ